MDKPPSASSSSSSANGGNGSQPATSGIATLPPPKSTIAARRGMEPAWSVDDSRSLYSIKGWGAGFFDINNAGRVVVRPHKTPHRRSTCTR